MSKTGYINARIEPSLKNEAGTILSNLGLSTTEAISLYFRQIVLQKGIPFMVKLPNEETINAINEIKSSEFRSSTKKFNNIDDLMADLNS